VSVDKITIGPIVLTQPAGGYVASRSCFRSGQQSVYIYRLFPSTTPTYILHLNCAINTAVPLQMHSFSNQTVSSNNSFLSEALQMLCRCLHRLMLDLRYFLCRPQWPVCPITYPKARGDCSAPRTGFAGKMLVLPHKIPASPKSVDGLCNTTVSLLRLGPG
jgi:hypothetical protein